MQHNIEHNNILISSTRNPLIKRIIGLKNKRQRIREGLFLIEGQREILHALRHGIALETVVYCRKLLSDEEILTTLESVHRQFNPTADPVVFREVASHVYARIAYRSKVGGLIALARIPLEKPEELQLSPKPLVLVVQGIQKPGNLGGLLRTADAVAVDAVIICDADVDLYNPNVVRASMGALFTVPVFSMPLSDALSWLMDRHITPILTSPSGEVVYSAMDYTSPTAIILGSEQQGLPRSILQHDIKAVKIPMEGAMDSLNLAVAGAILMYEAKRQRDLPTEKSFPSQEI